jgi:PAS domain S-box-containing protein
MANTPRPFNTDSALELQRLELALESAGVGTWELDIASNQVQWCHRTKKLFDYSGSDIIGFSELLDQIHPEDRRLFIEQSNGNHERTLPFSFSLELRTNAGSTGRTCWLLCKGRSYNNDIDTENPARVLGTFIDITKEVEDRKLLKEKQEHARSFQTVVEQAPMAIGLLRGPELIIELGNARIFEVWGKSPSITGMRLAEALPEIKDQDFLQLLENVYKTGVPFTGSGMYARLHRNGQLEDVYFDFVYAPLRAEDGQITGIMVMAHEVTQQHLTLKELEASEAKFRALIDQAPVATCLFVGEDMVIEIANQPMINYWGKDESIVGKPLREALPELVGQPFLAILDEIRATGTAYSSKHAAVEIKVNGKLCTYYFDFTYKPIFDSEGNIYGIINMSIDVTEQVLARKALEESESKLRAVIASAPAAIGLFVGRDLRVELPNQAFIDIVGKGPDIVGVPLRDVMPELENQPFLQILDDVYTTGVAYQSYGTQVNIVRQGTMTHNYYDITYSPVHDGEGNVYAILDIAIDVTERVNVEKRIQQSQMQLLELFEQSPVGIAIIRKEDLTFTMANAFYGKLVGRDPAQITGKPLLEALPEIKGQGFDELLKNVIETGIPFTSKEQQADISYNGILKTIYTDLAYQPQRDAEGNITGVLVVATDLTEQVQSRKRIEETEIFLRGAIELAQLGTYSMDIQSGTFDCSDRLKQWFGLEGRDRVTFKEVYAAIEEDDKQAVVSAFEEATSPGSSGLFDTLYTLDASKTGAARILHMQGRILYNNENKPVTIIGTAQDVTAQRKIKLALEQQVQQRTEQLEVLNEELAAINEEYIATNEELSSSNNMLQQSNVNLQQFAYVASHDLQEPLRKIRSFSDLLINRYAENLGDGITYLQRMQNSATRMSQLIEDLLAFSRITSHNEAIAQVSLVKIVNEVLNDLELVIAETSAEIKIGYLPVIQGDPMQLNQLFLNLVSNALKFRKPDIIPVINISGQIISVSSLPNYVNVTRNSGAYYKIDVVDNGIGFEQQYAKRVFQLFQRLHGRSEYEGTGIGLAICERVAANHGGAISVVSELGQGTTFSIYLPVG